MVELTTSVCSAFSDTLCSDNVSLDLSTCSYLGLLRAYVKYSISKKVKLYRKELELKFIDPRFGLVEELIASSVLSRSDAHVVWSKQTIAEKNKQIIEYALKNPSGEAHKFFAALSSNYQQHVANYILYSAGTRYAIEFGYCMI